MTGRIMGLILLLVLFTTNVMGQKSRGEETDTLIEINDEDVQVEMVEYEEDPIFVVVEEMPEFPGGQDSLAKFIAANLVYPVKAKENNIQGKVMIEFVVDEKGKVTNAKVIKGIGSGCDEEALRIVNRMPKWKPGKQRNKPVNVRFVLPIKFSLN